MSRVKYKKRAVSLRRQTKRILQLTVYRSVNTNNAYRQVITRALYDLRNDCGLRRLENLKEKHIEFIVNNWRKRGVSEDSIRNWLTFLRRFCKSLKKQSIVKDNSYYRIKKRDISFKDKIWNVDGNIKEYEIIGKLDGLDYKYAGVIKDVLLLERHFGLRMREAIHFSLKGIVRNKENSILGIHVLRGSKNNRYRFVSISNKEQVRFLEELSKKYNNSPSQSLKPQKTDYPVFRRRYYYVVNYLKKITGVNLKGHGLRQSYVRERYLQLMENKEYVYNSRGEQYSGRQVRREVYKVIAGELGHSRLTIIQSYLEEYEFAGK